MPSSSSDQPVSPMVEAFLELFDREAADLKFPGLDATTLNAAADRVRIHAEALRNAEAACEVAQSMLQESQEALLQQGHRALAYLRIYAEEKPELARQLDAVSLPRPLKKLARSELALPETSAREAEAPKRRGRPPKAKSDALFGMETPPDAAERVAAT